MKLENQEIESRDRRIKLLLIDCDGVLTDGRLILLSDGDEQKTFNVHDGHGIKLLQRAGLRAGIISGRSSSCVQRRAEELGMPAELVRQGCLDKIKAFEEMLSQAEVNESEVAFIGDDLPDIPIMRRAGLAFAVADAVAETKNVAHHVTERKGGRGAVREVADLILKAQGRWDELMARYLENRRQ